MVTDSCIPDGCDVNTVECENGGTPVSVGNGCVCRCREGTRGERCQYGEFDDNLIHKFLLYLLCRLAKHHRVKSLLE